MNKIVKIVPSISSLEWFLTDYPVFQFLPQIRNSVLSTYFTIQMNKLRVKLVYILKSEFGDKSIFELY